jgi:hypothetical protein
MATKKIKIPLWDDGTAKSTNSAFNWRSATGESSMLKDPTVKSQSTLLLGKASGRTAISPKRNTISLNRFKR